MKAPKPAYFDSRFKVNKEVGLLNEKSVWKPGTYVACKHLLLSQANRTFLKHTAQKDKPDSWMSGRFFLNVNSLRPFEPWKYLCYIPLYWLADRDPCIYIYIYN